MLRIRKQDAGRRSVRHGGAKAILLALPLLTVLGALAPVVVTVQYEEEEGLVPSKREPYGVVRQAHRALLAARHYTMGWIPEIVDLEQLFAAASSVRTKARPPLRKGAQLYQRSAANTTATAFGMGRNTALDHVAHAGDMALRRARAMNLALWPATWGHFFSQAFASVVTGGNLTWLRNWFANFVRGAGPLPALRIGAQPYGILPVTLVGPKLGTRGLAEATRVGEVRGGQPRTFAGLAGAGDLIAAVAGDGRPEIEFGRALAQGLTLEDAAARADAYIEGAMLAGQVTAFGARAQVEVPLSTGLALLMKGQISAEKLTAALMTRPATQE